MTLLKALGVWLLAAVLLTPPSLVGVTTHDEGFIATGAMLILRGKLPYLDFLSFYGPAQYYLAACLFAVFDEDLLVLRALHIGWLATLVVAVWLICRRIEDVSRGPTPALITSTPPRANPLSAVLVSRGAALASAPSVPAIVAIIALAIYVLPSAGYPAIPATVLLLFASLSLFDWNPADGSRRLLIASSLVGLAGLFRWDFGVFGLVVLSATVVITLWSLKASTPGYLRAALHVAVPAIAICAICYFPLLAILSDPRRWYQEIVEYSIYEFPKWRGTEFLRPSYFRWLETMSDGRVLAALAALSRIAYALVPPTLAIAAIGLMLRQFVGRRRPFPDILPAILYVTLLDLVLLQQMRVRPTLWQGFPAVVTAVPLAVYVFINIQALAARWRLGVRSVRAAGACALATLIAASVPNAWAAFGSGLVPLDPERASLIRVPSWMAFYGELVRHLRDQTSRSDFLYSGVVDHSKLLVNDSLIYFLTERLPADRFVELDPGIANTSGGQHELREALETRQVPTIVLLALHSREPNLTSSSNGVHILDQYIRSRYAEGASFGNYTVLRQITRSLSHVPQGTLHQ